MRSARALVEASGKVAALVTTLYGSATSEDERTNHFVNNIYLGAYGRSATTTELQQGRDALNAAAAQGQSQVQSQAETLGRSLFAGQVSDFSLTARQYVTNLYEGFLQRGPDAQGLSFWTTQAGSTAQARQAVLDAFATSPAFREISGTLYRETFWMVADQLGTPRMVVDKSGRLAGVKRHDYLPFGEEVGAGIGGRTAGQGYVSDSVRQKFAGSERDAETGLDYMQARYFSSAQGRFISPDPVAGSCWNPQSLNAYSYVWNNPLKLTDSTGMIVSWEDSEKKKKKGETDARTDAQRKYENRIKEMVNSKDAKTRERGLKLQATYERLQKSDVTFHVVKENPSDASSGELTYAGEEGHLYVNLKGNSNEYGALTDIQKLAHEFKHGEQFLDGKIGYITSDSKKWSGFRDDLPDEAEAFITGFEAQPLDPAQRSDRFLGAVETARSFGIDAVVDVLARQGPYVGRSREQRVFTSRATNVYAVPRYK